MVGWRLALQLDIFISEFLDEETLKSPRRSMTDFEYLSITKHEQIAIVTIDRQKKLNALNALLLKELEQGFAGLSEDDQLQGVILTGQGDKAFVAGADIKELVDLDMQTGRRASEQGQRVFSLIEKFPKPVLAAINGYALGGGCLLYTSPSPRDS